MASINPRTLANGKTSYSVQITRRKGAKEKPYREARAFPTLKEAEAYEKRREAELDADIAAGRPLKKHSEIRATLGDAIERYLDESMAEIGKTKAQVLKTIRCEYDIAEMQCNKITSKHIVEFVKELHNRPDLNSSSTALNYLSHLGAVWSVARPMWEFELDQQAMKDAQTVCSKMQLTAKSQQRDRRPTLEELDKLMSHFQHASEKDKRVLPMHRVVAFAIFSTRRQAEICRILWDDYEDCDPARVLVRKMKNPGEKGGIDTYCELPAPCPEIIAAMPRLKPEIFPYNSDTISRRFTEACKVLGIEDLRFHDLRHEGISRLAEIGRTVPQLASVSGHKSWSSLERYSHIRKLGDKFEDWMWLERVT